MCYIKFKKEIWSLEELLLSCKSNHSLQNLEKPRRETVNGNNQAIFINNHSEVGGKHRFGNRILIKPYCELIKLLSLT